jgi:hypothetical protein
MSKPLFNDKNCARRNRVAAVRDGVDTMPVKLYPSKADGFVITGKSRPKLTFSAGTLPSDLDDALAVINLSFDEKPFTKEDVYIHYMEAANSSFIGDRFMFLDATTLRNVARRGEEGIAFMNSHRTGGLSAPAELPMGRTFAGRYEEFSEGDRSVKRALLGVYMVKGQHPNGLLGPSTDDIHKGIEAGTINDVSIGLSSAGYRICDICTRELDDPDCPHIPGSKMGLTPEQIEAQKARGVADGKGSYTLVDGVPYEVSAVFKGAVEGAGFRKALLSMRGRGLKSRDRDEILLSYRGMVTGNHGKGGIKMGLRDFFARWQAEGEPDELESLDTLLSDTVRPRTDRAKFSAGRLLPDRRENDDGDLEVRRADLERQAKRLEAQRIEFRTSVLRVEGETFAKSLGDKVTPAERTAIGTLYTYCGLVDDSGQFKDGDGEPVSLVKLLKRTVEGRRSLGLRTEEVADGKPVGENERVLTPGDGMPEEVSPERLAQLLGYTSIGSDALAQAALAAANRVK